MSKFTFALPSGYEWEVKTFARQVKTKSWCKQYSNKLDRYRELLTRHNYDPEHIIGAMLQSAYGVNIGRQIEARLKPADIEKIRINLLSTY